MIGRALSRRCPRCGSGDVFSGWFDLVGNCPSCGLHFEREQGYWVGAMIINTAVAIVGLFGVFLLGLLLTWPDVPWEAMTIGTAVVAGLIPLVAYPYSKTLWLAYDLRVHPLEQAEEEAARNRTSGNSGPV
jgi:uncharacterized protein (DUF983 family)